MSRRPRIFRAPDAAPEPRWGSLGFEALGRADTALSMGDKLGALRAYGQAYNALSRSGFSTAPDGAKKAADAITALLDELGRAPFGPDLCDHGQSKNLTCWACEDRKAALKADLAKTVPDGTDALVTAEDLETFYAGVEQRRPNAEVIESVDEMIELKRKRAGGA